MKGSKIMSNSRCIDDSNFTSKSYWLDSTPETNYPTLKKDTTADIAIIGIPTTLFTGR